ncbi:MAG: hypothetical protein ACOYNL_06305 [Rickettsiales bacterium]
MIRVIAIAFLLGLSACAGYEKGKESGWGFDALDTISKEEKEEDKWFKSYYGKNHCYGQWAGDCEDDDSAGGGGGGMWTGGVGPSDSGSSGGSSD